MAYGIAYSDKNGKNFYGDVPWILDGISSEEKARKNVERLIQEGYKNVMPFAFEGKRKAEEDITWKYVKNHKI